MGVDGLKQVICVTVNGRELKPDEFTMTFRSDGWDAAFGEMQFENGAQIRWFVPLKAAQEQEPRSE